jgi:hypothetical protein
MTTITLPKTPLVPLFMDHDCRQELDAMFRARDLEVARLVLEGAEQVADACTAARISNIEVKHHE